MTLEKLSNDGYKNMYKTCFKPGNMENIGTSP